MAGEVECLVLHQHPELKESCANLMNSEWPRSLGARLHNLSKSCDSFPISLVLVAESQSSLLEVIAHSRLCVVIGDSRACFIESVVVKKNIRGKGLGRKIMEESEKFAKSKNIERLYLTTHDKQGFYSHLGYTYCQPIHTLGANSKLLTQHPKLFETLLQGQKIQEGKVNFDDSCNKETEINNEVQSALREDPTQFQGASASSPPTQQVPPSPGVPPPSKAPPPPPQGVPPLTPSGAPQPTPSGVPPPPPPKAPPPPGANLNDTKNDVVQRMDPSRISWMKKELNTTPSDSSSSCTFNSKNVLS